jgi:hypothetical protein
MSSKWVHRALLGAAVLATTAGCAEERDPINRVQANALAKTFFVGDDIQSPLDDPEFLTQVSLIDLGYGASQSGLFPSTFSQDAARVKFQITEDLLLARLTYERIADSDGKGVGAASEDGQIIAAFKILKHFDIRHGYNPSTGEELNVIEENTIDRVWNEREFMRVDWSKNLQSDVYDFDTLSMLGVFGVDYEPLAYYVNDPDDDDAPYFDVKSGYFDVTNKTFATPGVVDLTRWGWGKYPACWFPADFMGGSYPAGNCNPVELTVRTGFRKVVDTDYEPLDWDGYRFQSYGGFYNERYGYARNYGMSDDKWHRFLSRYNIWQRSHYYSDPDRMEGAIECYTPQSTPYGEDANRDYDGNGTADECEGVTGATGFPGSQCDTFKQKCTLPYRLRQPRQVQWYFSTRSANEYFDGTEWATHDHDVAMRHAIMAAKYGECVGTGGDPGLCAQDYPVYFGQMDDHLEAKQLAKEVDECRHGLTYPEFGTINSEQREAACVGLADSVANARSEGGARPMDPGVIALAKMPEQIVLCHSPVEANDPATCAPAGERLPAGITAEMCENAKRGEGDTSILPTCKAARNARRGDLRYHLVNVFKEPHTPSPWGIYVDAQDPLTGETFSASINVWSHVNDLWSQLVMDRIRFIKGELTAEDVTDGDYVRDWAKAAEASNGGGIMGHMDRDQVKRRIAGLGGVKPEVLDTLSNSDMANELREKAKQLKNELHQVKSSIDATSYMAPVYQARMDAVKGTELEAQLVDPMMVQMAGVRGMPEEMQIEHGSILRGQNPIAKRNMRNMMEMAIAERGACIYNEAPAPMAITGLGDALEQKFGAFNPGEDRGTQQIRAEKMRRYLAQRAHYAVIVHEMGHSVGERHNFVSSSDAYNYRPQYWQLRTNDGAVARQCGCQPGEDPGTSGCGSFEADGSQCVGPRFYDPVDTNERNNMIWMWMHSSVMDYAGEYTQDFLGLAAYDFGAHRMFYGDTVAVFSEPEYQLGGTKAPGMLSKMDSFGGILGIQPSFNNQDIHYSQIQDKYQVISDCQPVTVENYRPASWNDETQGLWHPTLDGFIVNVNGAYTKCRQAKVSYAPWRNLRVPEETSGELAGVSFYGGGGPALTPQNQIRVPYGFATDRWADLGNASVYRHDNGADVYEIFDFLATQQEVHHIFDNYRRGRQSFTVGGAAARTLGRYNEKIRDGAKGLGLMKNVYRNFFNANNWAFEDKGWAWIANEFFGHNLLASGMVFDHFIWQHTRPEAGGHYREGGILRSVEDSDVNSPTVEVNIPNGATGYFGQVARGGKLVENTLADDKGEYDAEFTMNAGSYYDKVYVPYLMAESADNFISDSRGDFVDGRYRAVSLADLFQEGFRRWLANGLTDDAFLKGPRLAASSTGNVMLDANNFPAMAAGGITWWTDNPEICFPSDGTTICNTYGGDRTTFDPRVPDGMVPIDPQVGWEQQKFMIALTMIFLPSNQKMGWIDMLKMWELGLEGDPGVQNRIEFHDPEGRVYVAKTFGKETIFGRTVHRGVAARVLEYANELLVQAYETTPVDYDLDGETDWYLPVYGANGQPLVKYDPLMQFVDPATGAFVTEIPGCSPTDNTACTCNVNQACSQLQDYVSVPHYMWQWSFITTFPLYIK